MGRMTQEQAEALPQAGGKFFRLAEDKDTKRVRFLYDKYSDIDFYAVHKINEGQRYLSVDCMSDEEDGCPICQSGTPKSMPVARAYLQLLDVDTGEVCTWERSLQFVKNTIEPQARRNPHLYQHVFEIERQGVKGSLQTTYMLYPLADEYDGELRLEDLPAPINIIEEGVVKQWSYVEMQSYVETGNIPSEQTQPATKPAAAPRTTQRGGRNATSPRRY